MTSFDVLTKWKDLDSDKCKIVAEAFTKWTPEFISGILDTKLGLNFIASSIFDPVLLFHDLQEAKVLDYNIKIYHVIYDVYDVTITMINWNRFQHLIDTKIFESLTFTNTSEKLQKIFKSNIKESEKMEEKKKEKKEIRPEDKLKRYGKPISLNNEPVSAEDWYLYWNEQGKPCGPDNGWEIPTMKKLRECLDKINETNETKKNKKLKL